MIEKPKLPENAKIGTALTPMERVALRNSWLKICVFGSLTLVTVVKIWQADFSSALSDFDFSDLLALFLAMFSIGLSVLFYLKATDTSNVFYDNTYRFTKDVSEILGRVEAGFGERLKHLDDGYTSLKTAVEKIPYDRRETEKEIKEEEAQVQKVEEERTKMIEELAQRARLQEEEKTELFARLRTTDEELSNARRELHFLRRRMLEAENSRGGEETIRVSPRIQHYLRMIGGDLDRALLLEAPIRIVNREFKSALTNHPEEIRMEFRKAGILDEDMDLTRLGLEALRNLFH